MEDKISSKLVEMVEDPYNFYYPEDFKKANIPFSFFDSMKGDTNHLMIFSKKRNFGFLGGYILGYSLKERVGTKRSIDQKPKGYSHLDPIRFCQTMEIFYDDLPQSIQIEDQSPRMLLERVQLGDELAYRIYVGNLVYLSIPSVKEQDLKDLDLRDLVQKYRLTHEKQYKDEYTSRAKKLVKSQILKKHLGAIIASGKDIDSFESAGNKGADDVFERFDLTIPVKVETYLPHRVRGEILDQLRSLDKVPRLTRSVAKEIQPLMQEAKLKGQELSLDQLKALTGRSKQTVKEAYDLLNGIGSHEVSLDKIVIETDSNKEISLESILDTTKKRETLFGHCSEVERVDNLDLLSHIISCLNPHEQEIVVGYYLQGNTMKEIGNALGLSESRISQEHSMILEKLKGLGQRMQDVWIK